MERRPNTLKQAAAVGKVYAALLRDRWNLRRAARRAGSPDLKRTLHRLAVQRGRDADELAATEMPVAAGAASDPTARSVSLEIERIGEVGAFAACLRSNRQLRITIERALATQPPRRVVQQLNGLAVRAEREAGTIEARFAELSTSLLPSINRPTIVD